jgi:hypothetical protein
LLSLAYFMRKARRARGTGVAPVQEPGLTRSNTIASACAMPV